jgi:hypothetical protein
MSTFPIFRIEAMNRPASQQGAKLDLRQTMPETAKWVTDKRVDYGKDYVNDCIRRAMNGEAGLFYAMERGQFLGTPFPATHPIAKDQDFAVMVGASFAAFIALPSAKVASS